MIYTIVGCGDSATGWIPNGTSIGSNDCEKFGRGVDHLLLANHPGKFRSERLAVIKRTTAQVWCTSRGQWVGLLPLAQQLTRAVSFSGYIRAGFVYTSATTPIMCMSMAINKGARQLVLWGVDMITHHAYRKGTKYGDREIGVYEKFFAACRKIKVEVYIGSHGTAFDKSLPLWTTAQ